MELNQKLGSTGTPKSELEINTALVFDLIKEQHPDLSRLPILVLTDFVGSINTYDN